MLAARASTRQRRGDPDGKNALVTGDKIKANVATSWG